MCMANCVHFCPLGRCLPAGPPARQTVCLLDSRRAPHLHTHCTLLMQPLPNNVLIQPNHRGVAACA